MRLLVALVQVARPSHVLELGSGLSTAVFARACAEYAPECRITSVDSDPDFSEEVAHRVRGERATVVQQVAPLVLREYAGEIVPVYRLDPAGFASQSPPDIVLIDGPPDPLGGRVGTLYQLMPLMRPGTLVVLDDASRPGEQAAVTHWRERLGEAIEVRMLEGLTGGMAAVIVKDSVARDAMWSLRLGAAARTIMAAVPVGRSFGLVDNGACADELLEAVLGRDGVIFGGRGGVYEGSPADDGETVAELRRVQDEGAGYIAVAWPAFWWLDTYPRFASELRSHRKIAGDGNALVFQLS